MFKYWLLAIRPKTLILAINPVVLGIAIAYAEGFQLNPWAVIATLIVALSLQIAVNLHNDLMDHQRGIDGPDRLGPPRASAQGWLSPDQLLKAFYLFLGLAVLFGLYLVYIGGQRFLILGLGALLATWLYSGGRYSISHLPLGEVVVFVFFGLIAVGGAHYIQTQMITPAAIWLSISMGLLAAAVLLVNNYRDRDSDARAGRYTLAVILSDQSVQFIYAVLLLLPLFLPLNIGIRHGLLLGPVALYLIDKIMTLPRSSALNGLLIKTVLFQLLYTVVMILVLLRGNEPSSMPPMDQSILLFLRQS